jgi:aminopeptidase N
LVLLSDASMLDLAYQQYRGSVNITDIVGGLNAMNAIDCQQRTDALDHFYKKWYGESLVMDKWLSMQAGSCIDGGCERVKKLMDDPIFDLLNPNKVRALMGAFSCNLIAFHEHSGAGYQLLADMVLALDPHNRLTAARICEPLIRWRKLDVHRQSLMKAQLLRIMDTPELSKDVYEMVSKSLDYTD